MRFIFRRLCCLLLAAVLCFAMAACQGKEPPDTGYTRYTTQFFDTFDTIIQITGYTKTQEEFEGYAQFVHERFAHLSKLYDRFYEYTGVNNVRTINQNAGIAPVEVEPELLEMLAFAKDQCQRSGGRVNIAMGPALELWHGYRERYAGMALPEDAPDAYPAMEALEEADQLSQLDKVIIDQDAGTVFLEEPGMALDVGAVAKGYAAQLVADEG